MTAATAEALRPRLVLLFAVIRAQGGQWTTARVGHAYAAHGYDAPKHTTHSRDPETLHRAGHLQRHDTKGRTYYTLREA